MTGLVTRASLGAWLIKCNPRVTDVDALVRNKRGSISSWCVTQNYRAEMMVPGDPVVFWISGSERGGIVPGVWGLGHLTGRVAGMPRPSVPLHVRLLADPVPRTVLRTMTAFAGAEVLRQPMGSNPSWLDKRQWPALLPLVRTADGPCPSANVS